MVQARGNQSKLVMDFENTFGTTPGTPAGKVMPFNSDDVSATQDQTQPETITGQRSAVKPIRGNEAVNGNIAVPVDVRSFGWWLAALFGAPSTTGTSTPYTHTYKISSTQPSMVMEKGFTDIGKYLVQNGCKVNSLEMSTGGDGELTATVGIEGQKESNPNSSSFDGSATELTFDRFQHFQAALKEGGSTISTVTELSLSIAANMDTDQYTIGNNGQRSGLPEGIMQVTGNLSSLFSNTTLLNKAINSTESSLELTFTNGSHSLKFSIGELEYARTSPGIDGPSGIMLPLDFTAYSQDSGDNSSIVVELVNDVSGYTT